MKKTLILLISILFTTISYSQEKIEEYYGVTEVTHSITLGSKITYRDSVITGETEAVLNNKYVVTLSKENTELFIKALKTTKKALEKNTCNTIEIITTNRVILSLCYNKNTYGFEGYLANEDTKALIYKNEVDKLLDMMLQSEKMIIDKTAH
jgi:hypothetical protein